MIVLTEPDVTASIERVVARRGSDFAMSTTCYYQHPTEPDLRCLIGEVFYDLLDERGWEFCTSPAYNDLTVPVLLDYAHLHGVFELESDRLRKALLAAQEVQDSHRRWGEALEAYHGVLK